MERQLISYISRTANSALSKAIYPEQFLTVLTKIWRPHEESIRNSKPTKIGLAVSGGPDSMVLVDLFQRLRSVKWAPRLDITALIVDHGHRPDSGIEALEVSRAVEKLGIKAKIQKIDWLREVGPDPSSNFETVARRFRFRQLALGCLKGDIRHLFLGHHLDDQIESFMLRLINGAGSLGSSSGIKPVNIIPCCNDIFGAESGFETYLPNKREKTDGDRLPLSHPGLHIYRPLLTFPKSRILSTCAKYKIPYITDPTNSDPKLTKRNAVRQLLSNETHLPRALRKSSLAEQTLTAARIQESREGQTIRLLQATQVISYDPSCGMLIFSLPLDMAARDTFSVGLAVSYLARLLRIVSPMIEQNSSNAKLIPIAEWMFNGQSGSTTEEPIRSNHENEHRTRPLAMTARGVLIERLQSSSTVTWQLSRRPFTASESPETGFPPAPLYASEEDKLWSGWTLWDGRHWIRIRVPKGGNLSQYRIRPLLPSDLTEIRHRRGEGEPATVAKWVDFKKRARGKVRYTLPVLASGAKAVALPTFDLRLSEITESKKASSDATAEVRWEVRYKQIGNTLRHLRVSD